VNADFSSLPAFTTFVEDVLIEGAAQQRAEQKNSVPLFEILARLNVGPFDGWIEQVVDFLEARGWVKDYSTLSERRFRVLGAGFAEAERIRQERRPKSLTDRLASDRTQRLLNVGAFATSLVSLCVAIIALVLSGK
jgi:hypothetical protein